MYIGHGKAERAWAVSNRDPEHLKHLEYLISTGYHPGDWVKILAKGLLKETACEFERDLIHSTRPRYNKVQGEKLLKVTPEMIKQACFLRDSGLSYDDIAKAVNVSTMTIHRAMNKKIPALEAIFARH